MRVVARCSLIAAVAVAAFANVSKAVEQTVYLLGGQSNMLGRASASGLPTSPVNLRGVQSDVNFFFHDPASSGANYDSLVKLQPLTSSATTFGPEITFGRAMKDANPAKNITLIKYADGGTTLASDWKPQTGPDYIQFKATVAAGLAAITARGDTYKIAGMLWLQGESDTGAGAAAYGTNIANFISDMRSNYGANLPFVMGGIGYQTADYTTVSAALQNAANTIPNTAYFSDYDLLGTSHTTLHFDAASQQIIGQRFATAISALPEPSAMAIVGIGSAAGILQRRRAISLHTTHGRL
jgi:hypothetical protein